MPHCATPRSSVSRARDAIAQVIGVASRVARQRGDDDDMTREEAFHFAKALGAVDAVRSGGARERDVLDVFELWDDDGGAAIARALASRDDDVALRALGERDVESARRAARARDEDGWNATHYAVHYGHFRALRALVCACDGALDDKTLELTPLDVASGGLVNRRVDESWRFSRDDADIEPKDAGESRVTFTTHYVYSWGSGVNFTLGTGSTETSRACARVETLARANIRECSTSKYHSLAVDADGKVWAWGCTRDGVLGLDQCAGAREDEASAVIFPTRLGASTFGLNVVIASVSTGVGHSAAVALSGDVYTWGNGRHGRLGYVVVAASTSSSGNDEGADDAVIQFLPKKVPNIEDVVKVSCGDAHTVFLDRQGDVWTVGNNSCGQLGYFVAERANDGARCGAPDDICCSTPKRVEYLKHRDIYVVDVSASKAHTVVASDSVKGDVYSWGHGSTSLRRVNYPQIDDIVWDLLDRRVVCVSAGEAHSAAVTRDGWLLVWASASMDRLDAEYVRVPGGHGAVDVSCGQTRCVVASACGNAYVWDATEHAALKRTSFGTHASTSSPPPSMMMTSKSPSFGESPMGGGATSAVQPSRIRLQRVTGLKGVTRVFAGDAHFLAFQGVARPITFMSRNPGLGHEFKVFELLSATKDPLEMLHRLYESYKDDLPWPEVDDGGFPSLCLLAQFKLAGDCMEPRNAMSIIQLAGNLGCDPLKLYAMSYVCENLDVVLMETPLTVFSAIDDDHLDTLTAISRDRNGKRTRTIRQGVEDVEDIRRAALIGRRLKPAKQRVVADEATEAPPPPSPSYHLALRVKAGEDAGGGSSSGGKPPRGGVRAKVHRVKGSLSTFLSGGLENGSTTGALTGSSWNTSPSSITSLRDEVAALTQELSSLARIQEQQLADSAQLRRTQSPSADAPPPVFSPSPVSPNTVSLGALIRRDSGRRGGGRGSTSASAWRTSAPSGAGVESMSVILAREAAARDAEATHAVTTGFNVASSSADGHRWYVPDGAQAPAGVSLRDIQRSEAERVELEDALRAIEAQETAEALALINAASSSNTKARRRKPATKSKPKSKPETPTPTSVEPTATSTSAPPNKPSRRGRRRTPRTPKDTVE